MKLVIDVGNSRTKYGLFKNGALEESGFSSLEPVYVIKDIYEKHPEIEALIISSVNQAVEADLIPIPETIHHVIFDPHTPVPLQNHYQGKSTLGADRLANAVAAVKGFPGENVLVIDAGTCITYDVVDAAGTYLGGAIAPGLQMRFNALHRGTARLPQIEADMRELPGLIGITTEASMKSGVVNGMTGEINGMIDAFRELYPSLQVVLTGGNMTLFESGVKSSIFADANFVLRGLHQILLYNLPV